MIEDFRNYCYPSAMTTSNQSGKFSIRPLLCGLVYFPLSSSFGFGSLHVALSVSVRPAPVRLSCSNRGGGRRGHSSVVRCLRYICAKGFQQSIQPRRSFNNSNGQSLAPQLRFVSVPFFRGSRTACVRVLSTHLFCAPVYTLRNMSGRTHRGHTRTRSTQEFCFLLHLPTAVSLP